MSLSWPSMRSWIHAFCAGQVMCMNSHADVPAVGAAQDLQDLAHGRRLEAQHLVDEDRPVEVGLGEAVGLGLAAPCAPCARRGPAGRGRRRDGPSRGRRGSASARGCCPGWRAARRPGDISKPARAARGLQLVAQRALGLRRSRRSAPPTSSRSPPCSICSSGLAQRRPAAARRRRPSRCSSCRLAKKWRHSSLTEPGLRSYCACISST